MKKILLFCLVLCLIIKKGIMTQPTEQQIISQTKTIIIHIEQGLAQANEMVNEIKLISEQTRIMADEFITAFKTETEASLEQKYQNFFDVTDRVQDILDRFSAMNYALQPEFQHIADLCNTAQQTMRHPLPASLVENCTRTHALAAEFSNLHQYMERKTKSLNERQNYIQHLHERMQRWKKGPELEEGRKKLEQVLQEMEQDPELAEKFHRVTEEEE